jgi:transposase
MGQVTVIAGNERRRRWTDEERISILIEAFSPGTCVADVARRRDVSTSLIYTWRRQFLIAKAEPAQAEALEREFAEVVMVEDATAPSARKRPAIVIDLMRGKRVSIFSSAPPAMVAAVLKALR